MIETTVEIPTRILILGMTKEDGSLEATELHEVAEACALSAEQVRSCLRRLVAEGLYTRTGEGRDATFQATDAGRRALGTTIERTRLAYAQDAAGRGWDRRWRLVAFAIPEARRSDRDALRDHLLVLGGAALHNGLYASPHRWADDVLAMAARLGIEEHVTVATTDDLVLGGEADPSTIARRLWHLDDLAASYERFIAEYGGVPDALEDMRKRKERLTEREFLPGALAMAIRFQQCFNADPLLPPELLPRPWPGRAARDIVIRSRRLGVLARDRHDRPSLFRTFDEAIETIP